MCIWAFSVRNLFFQALLVHLDMVPVALPILREISESRLNFMRTVEPTRWIRRLHRECRRRYWLQGLGWHLGHSHWFSWGWLWGQSFRTGEFVDKPLHCFLGECCQGSIVSKEHVTHKNSFDFGLGAEASYVEEFTLCGRVQWIGQEERKDSKDCPG